MRTKVIAAASGGRERSPIAKGSGSPPDANGGNGCFLFPLPPKAGTRRDEGVADLNAATPVKTY